MKDIVFKSVSKSYNGKKVLDDISFTIPAGSKTVLVGPSGAGKSTILSLIASVQNPDQGEISGTDQRVSLSFDQDLLYPKLSALDNIKCGLPLIRSNRAEIEKRALEMAALFHCLEFTDQKTETLSAGQKQRTVLARTFMKDPETVLLDESFNALDLMLKKELMAQILTLQKEKGFTLISVTHDFGEASFFADDILVLDHGKIAEQGNIRDITASPASAATAQGLGWMTMNLLPGSWFDKNDTVLAGVFPYDILLEKPEHPEKFTALPAEAVDIQCFPFGSFQVYSIENQLVRVLTPPQKKSGILWIPKDKVKFFEDAKANAN